MNCQREIFHNQTCGQPTMHICGLGVYTASWRAVPSPDAGRLRGSNLPHAGLDRLADRYVDYFLMVDCTGLGRRSVVPVVTSRLAPSPSPPSTAAIVSAM